MERIKWLYYAIMCVVATSAEVDDVTHRIDVAAALLLKMKINGSEWDMVITRSDRRVKSTTSGCKTWEADEKDFSERGIFHFFLSFYSFCQCRTNERLFLLLLSSSSLLLELVLLVAGCWLEHFVVVSTPSGISFPS